MKYEITELLIAATTSIAVLLLILFVKRTCKKLLRMR